MTPFEVTVKETNKESGLKKGEAYTVYHVYWYIQQASALDIAAGPPRDILYFLIYNKKVDRFMYELSSNFKPAGRLVTLDN